MKQNLFSVLSHYHIRQPEREVKKKHYYTMKLTVIFKVNNLLYFTYIMKKKPK